MRIAIIQKRVNGIDNPNRIDEDHKQALKN